MPINFSKALKPFSLSILYKIGERYNIHVEKTHANKTDAKSSQKFVLYDLVIIMIVASAEGPAIRGIAIGTIKGSSTPKSETFPFSPGKIIFKAITKKIIPPAIVTKADYK